MAPGAQDQEPLPPDRSSPGTSDPAIPEDLGRLQGLLERGRGRFQSERQRAEAQFERHRDRPVVDVAVRIWQRDRESAGSLVGSALAFRLFLFFVPLLVFFVGIAGFVASWTDPDEVTQATSVSGVLADQIRTALSQPTTTRWLAVIAGFVGMLTAGRSLSKAMVAASTLTWRLPVRVRASVKVVGALVGVIVGIVLCSVLVNRLRVENGIAVAGVSVVGVIAVYLVGWIVILFMLPRATPDPGALVPGAVLIACTTAALQVVSQFYIPSQVGRASELYGAVSATVVTLGWFFIIGRVVVLGMAINAVLYERFGSISTFVFSLPVVSILPRHSAWIRRFFGLEGASDDRPAEAGPGEPSP
jgi:uncharacterized BrkB/YihY/UPF0761 family membrane protein